jgi:hypothetical protein
MVSPVHPFTQLGDHHLLQRTALHSAPECGGRAEPLAVSSRCFSFALENLHTGKVAVWRVRCMFEVVT